MSKQAPQFSYAEPKPVAKSAQSRVEAEMGRRARELKPPNKRFATMLADQLQLPADSLLRRDLINPMVYADVVPQVQAEMAEHIRDFSAAAEQICTAIREGKTIGISADYDADGNTSLALFIRMLRACGVPREKIIEHIPNRGEDGYGVNEAVVEDFAKHTPPVDMMITLDNGTRAEKPIKKALDSGMEVIVIDHHGDTGGNALPPEVKVVNPNILANVKATKQSPYLEETKNLAAVGVSYMMAVEVMKRMSAHRDPTLPRLDPKPLLGLQALGMIPDVVKMGWLNRVLGREGLEQIRQGEDKNILRFMRGAGIEDPTKITETDIAFRLGPIINAPGRLGDSVAWAFLSAMQGDAESSALEAAITHTLGDLHDSAETIKPEEQKAKEANLKKWREANPDKIRHVEKKSASLYDTIPENPYLDRLIQSSVAVNEQRKDIEFMMRPEIRVEAEKQSNMPIRVIAGEDWHEGVIGIAASRVKEEFGLPSVIGSIKQLVDGSWQAKFSARSIRVPGYPVDIGAAFGALSPQHANDTTALLAKAGGHPMAAGATILAASRAELDEKISRFSAELNERLGADTERAIAHRTEQIFGTLDLSASTIDSGKAEVSFEERLNVLLDAIPRAGPFGEAMRWPPVAIRGVGIYSPEPDAMGKRRHPESRRGHLNFDIKGDHAPWRIYCRASHAGGTALADQLHELKNGLKKGIVIGQLTRKADGTLQMEVEHVLPDNGLAANPAFTKPGIFGLVGLGREPSARIT